MTAIFVLPLSIFALRTLPLDLGELAERAALLSAMVNMPEGSLALLEQRFGDRVDRSYYQGSENSVAPYVAPWNDPEAQPQAAPPAPQGVQPFPAGGKRPPIPAPAPPADSSHPVPKANQGAILQENMAGTTANLLSYGHGKLRNYTELPDAEVESIMAKGMNLQLENTDAPQVLLFHTHATESFEPYDSENYDIRNTWRSTDNTKNMIAVGDVLEQELKKAGIGVLHDKTQHDYPSYNGSYERSAETIKGYLKKYPTIKIALDIHRDAIQREDRLIVKPVTQIGGKKAAQLMLITGSDDGTMDIPNWQENLRFAAQVQNAIESDWPHLTRPIFFCYRKYNMDLTSGSLLFEVGSQANTLEESLYTAELVGRSLGKLLNANRQPAPKTDAVLKNAPAAVPVPAAASLPED